MAGRAQITVQQLRGAITTLSNSFDRLNNSVSPAATSTKTLAKSFQTLNTALGEIKKYAIELNTALDSIVPQGGKGNIKFKPNLFSAFNTVIESINNSVDANALKEFKTRANSMRSFVLSLKDMVSINKNFGEVTGLLNKMNTPATKGGTDSPLQSIIDMINSLGAISSRTQVYGSNTNGSTTLKNIINPKIQGIRDVIKLLSDIVPTLKTFVDDKIEPARQALTSVEYPIKSFVTSLSGIVDRIISETTKTDASGTSTKKPVSLINPKIQGIRDIAKTIQMVAQDIVPMAEENVSTAAGKLKDIYPKIIEFITQLSAISSRGEKDITDKSGNKKTISILNKNVQGVRDISKTISILSTDLATLADEKIKTAIANLQKLREPLWYFISQIGNLAPRQPDQNKKGELIHVLNSKLQGIRDIGRTIKVFVTDFKELNIDINTAIQNLNNLKQPLSEFITQVGQLGVRGTGQQGTGTNAKPISTLNASLQGIRDIARTMKVLATDLQGLSGISYVITQLGTIKDEIIKFISGFTISDKTAKLNFDYGREVLDKIANVLKKYSKIVTELNTVGSGNISDLAGKFKDFIEKISSSVNNPKLTKINTNNIKNLSSVAQAFKSIFNLLSSVSKGSFAGFTKNLDASIPKLEEFIDKMAALASRSTFPDFERVSNSLSNFNVKLKDVSNVVEHTTNAFRSFKAMFGRLTTAIFGVSILTTIVKTMRDAVKEMFNLEYAMKRVNTIARVSDDTLKSMTERVQSMSIEYGMSASKIAKALYDINSATIKGVSGMKILEQSAKLAVAGFTDIDKVTSLIARAVNAYEYSASEASKISDILFVTVERGINPMEELSEYMGRLFTVAASAGVSLEEVGAGLATLTARGYQTNVASTSLNSAILKLSTGTDKLNKLFKQYGYVSSASALRTMGLTGALQVLYKATGGATEKLKDLGFNYRDIRAAVTLASGAIKDYNETLSFMEDETYKAGLATNAFNEAQDTVIFKWNKLKESFKVGIQEIGASLNANPLIQKGLDILIDSIDAFRRSADGAALSFKESLENGFVSFIPKIITVTTLFKSFGKTVFALKSVPWIAGWLVLLNEFLILIKDISEAWDYLGESIKNSWKQFLDSPLRKILEMFTDFIGFLGDALTKVFGFDTNLRFDLSKKWGLYFGEPEQKEGLENPNWEQQYKFNKKVQDKIDELRRLSIVSPENINVASDKSIQELNDFGKSLQLSDKWIQENIKAYISERDKRLKESEALWNLMPKTKALADVMGDASKRIEESSKKSAYSWGDSIKNVVKANLGLSTVSQETGFSTSMLKNAFATKENIDAFTKSISIDSTFFESAYKKASNQGTSNIDSILYNFITFIENDMKQLPEFAQKKLQDVISRAWTDLAGEKDSKKIIAYFTEALQLGEEFNKATQNLTEVMPEAIDDFLKFGEITNKLGDDLTKLDVKGIDLQEILDNVFGLREVDLAKEALINKLVSFKDITSFDSGLLDTVLFNTLSDMLKGMHPDKIEAQLREYAQTGLGLKEAEDISNVVNNMLGSLTRIASSTNKFMSQLSELDFTKAMNKLKFGSEVSAFEQYKQVGKGMLNNLYGQKFGEFDFRTLLVEFENNKRQYGFDEAQKMFMDKFGEEGEQMWSKFATLFKELGGLVNTFIAPINTEFRNLKKRGLDFVKNYRDSLLSPIEQFQKTEALLNRQLANIKAQAKKGEIKPESIKNAQDTIEKLYKLNEETMNLKVPASITASEFVRSGSKEAFDLVARNVFKDTYKVNVRQEKLQEKLVNYSEKLWRLAEQGSKNVSESVTYP